MKRILMLLAVLFVATSCGDDDSPTTPADNNHIQYKATLNFANEVAPGGTNAAESAGRGEATIDLNLTRDSAGTITAANFNFRVDLTGFPATTAITLAHIHTGAAGVAGPVLVSAEVSSGQVTLVNGAGTFSRLNITTSVANAQAIMNNPPGFYLNVHSQANPGGVVRGQLVQQ